MTPTRKITFQLASLLDLLLIVMFSQYLEVQVAAEKQEQRMEAEQQSSKSDLEKLQQQLSAMQRQLKTIEEQQRTVDQAEFKQQEQLGRTFGELFRIPEATIQKIIKQRNQDNAGLTDSEASALKKEFQSLASSRGEQVVDHLLTYVEMKKRLEVRELYLKENRAIVVTSGTHQKR